MRTARTLLTTATFLAFVATSLAAAPAPVPDGKPHKLRLHDKQFWIDDQPLQIIAGEMHLSRIPSEFWEDRIKKARAMGLNTVSVYLFWNQIEPIEGKFDWTGMNDVRRFVKLCQEHLAEWLAVTENDSGMQLLASFTRPYKDSDVVAAAVKEGLDVQGISINYHSGEPEHGLLLGYAAMDERQILRAVLALRAAFVRLDRS